VFSVEVIDLVESVSGLKVDLFVNEVRTFDCQLPAYGRVDQFEAIFIFTLMQTVLAYRWLMYGFPVNFCVNVSLHQLYTL
jgi:hypothetical protein